MDGVETRQQTILMLMEIEFCSPESEINPENDNADVRVRLDDGRKLVHGRRIDRLLYWRTAVDCAPVDVREH